MPEKILIIDDDVDTLRLVGLMLQRQGYQIIAANNGEQGLAHADAEAPDLILLDVMMPQMDGYEVARRLRANPETANIPILMFTAKTQLDDKVTGFEAGADDYLTKPTHPTELQAHVKALLSRSSKGRGTNPPSTPTEPAAYFTGVLAPRGGLGVSTIAVNLAVSLLKKTNGEVILAEFRPGQGTIGIDLNLSSSGGLVDLLCSNPTDITRARIREELATHQSGLKFLPASFQPRDTSLMANTAQFESLIGRLAFMGAFIVLDLGSGLPASVQKFVKNLHEVLVVTEPMPATLIHTRALIEDLVDLGVDLRKISVVANYRIRSDLHLSVAQIQEQLGHQVAISITPAPEVIQHATRNKTAAVLVQADNLTTKQFDALADQIIERAPKAHRK
jgi:CheY-like chemotaxis protein/MinD-like ATPase involved in chromosome partitioning or flagellar assembly